MTRVAPRPDNRGRAERPAVPADPAPDTAIGLVWAIVSRRSVTLNVIMVGLVVAAAVLGLAYLLGPTGVGAVVATLGAGKGAQAVARWRRRRARRST